MKYNKFKIHLYWILGLALCISCSEDSIIEEPSKTGGTIGFSIEMSDAEGIATRSDGSTADSGKAYDYAIPFADDSLYLVSSIEENIGLPQTRATQVTDNNLAKVYASFVVNAFAFNDNKEWDEVKKTASAYITNEVINFNSPVSEHLWPGDGYKLHFIAYTPAAAKGAEFDFTDDRLLKVNYTVPTDVADQKDILMATPVDADCSEQQPVALDFHHILTSIKVKAKPSEALSGKITKISFKNVVGSGSYTYGDNAWTGGESDATYSVIPNVKIPVTGETVSVVDGDNTFVMIPQTLGENAQMEIVVEKDGASRTLAVNMNGLEWPMSLTTGKTVVYTLSYDFELGIELKEEDVSYRGGSNTYIVSSKKKLADGTLIDADWTVDNTTLPEWAKWEKDDEGNLKITLKEVALTHTINHEALLKKNPQVSGVYDLSTNGGTTPMNTANCYIVNAPGSYKLPLVYGNAIKNGMDNKNSYDPPIEIDTYPQITHAGYMIENPYIYNNKDSEGKSFVPKDAVLIWLDAKQDVENFNAYTVISETEGLVRNVKLDDEKKYLLFDVDSEIYQGNAIVAVRDNNGTIMWSWHIWVTDYKPNGTVSIDCNRNPEVLNDDRVVTNRLNLKYTFMPIQIGWVYVKDELYAERSCTIRIRQVETGKYQEITITQPGDRIIDGYCPYYQQGRKDPIVPGEGKKLIRHHYVWNVDYSPVEGAETGYYRKDSDHRSEMGDYTYSIRNPHIFVTNDKLELDGNTAIYNLWNNNCNEAVGNPFKAEYVIKTVDDPSPVGYCVPPITVFSGFVRATGVNGNSYESGDTNTYFVSGDEHREHEGVILYCNQEIGGRPLKKDPSGGVIYFPARGEVNHGNPTVNNFYSETGKGATTGVLTSSSAEEDGKHLVFYATPSSGIQYSHEIRGRGFPVRAIRESGDILKSE